MKKSSYFNKSIFQRLMIDLACILLAVLICIGGCVFIIYHGPSRSYRSMFDSNLKAWVQEHIPQGRSSADD
ncbi:MAG: hypothetical protein IJM08_03160 [Firmicutes bacterium]|jgi:hypothetical protein|nr:hypothetical protein [Bacillota bacterium]